MTEIPVPPIDQAPDPLPPRRRPYRPRGPATPPDSIEIPFPLRDGVTVLIRNLPGDLTPREAERLVVFIRTLALPEGPAVANAQTEPQP